MNDDARTRARTFLQVILDDLYAFSNKDFQYSVWIRGDHPKGYVQDYVEAVKLLRDFAGWLLENDYWRNVPLTSDQAAALKQFFDEVMAFDDTLPERESHAAITDPAWPELMSSAAKTLTALLEGSHQLRPQVSTA